MNKIIVGTIVSVMLLGGVIWLSYPDGEASTINREKPAGNPTALAVENNNFDFGKISMVAGNVSQTFRIKNTSEEEITITKMYTSCMCTTAELKIGESSVGPFGMPGHGAFIPKIQEKLGAGQEAEVIVVFDPAAHGPAGVGGIERAIFIENSSGDPLEIEFKANVTP